MLPEPTKEDWDRVTVLATADIDGRLVTKTIGGLGEVKLEKPAQYRVSLLPDDPKYTSADQGLIIEPGTTITAKIVIERNGHEDDVRFDVDNLPHGIIVDNIGLSGVLVRKGETERQIYLTARPWVPETDRLIHAVAQGAGGQASPAIRLHVRRADSVVSKMSRDEVTRNAKTIGRSVEPARDNPSATRVRRVLFRSCAVLRRRSSLIQAVIEIA